MEKKTQDPELDLNNSQESDNLSEGEETTHSTPETEFDRPGLESRVRDKLSDIFGDEGPDEDQESDNTSEEEEESEDAGNEESGEEDEDNESESAGSDADADEGDAEEAAVEDEHDPNAPTLPDSHRRSLKAYGWKDEEIDQNLRALGAGFISTAARIHENRNAELAHYAAAGRSARDQQTPTQESRVPSSGTSSVPNGLQRIDAAALKEKYGDDDLVDALVGPVNATVDAINKMLPTLQAGQQAAQQAEVDRVGAAIESFFNTDALKPYQSLYGSVKTGLTEANVQVRNRVLETAYDLITGASALRQQHIPLEEGLTLAHELVSKDFKTTAVREGIKKEAKKRQRGLSLKPSKTRTQAMRDPSGTPRNRAELEARTRDRLRAVFSERT